MKITMVAIVMLINSECVVASNKWTRPLQALWHKAMPTGEAKRGRATLLQAATLAVALLTSPLGGFADEGSDARHSPPARSEEASSQPREMTGDLKGWGYLRMGLEWNRYRDSAAQNVLIAIANASREDAGTMRLLTRIRLNEEDRHFFGLKGIFGFNALDFAQEKVAPLVYAEFRADTSSSLMDVLGAGVGFEFIDNLLVVGNNTSVQLHAGLGRLSSLVYTGSANEQDRLIDDEDAVISLKLIAITDGITFGDMLNKRHDSYWHWVSIFPRVKVVMALHKPIFDRDKEYSGNMVHSLQAQLSFVDSLHLTFEHTNSPSFQKPDQRIGVRFDFYEVLDSNNYGETGE